MAQSNPWGVDQNKYYQNVGSVGSYMEKLQELMSDENISQNYKVRFLNKRKGQEISSCMEKTTR